MEYIFFSQNYVTWRILFWYNRFRGNFTTRRAYIYRVSLLCKVEQMRTFCRLCVMSVVYFTPVVMLSASLIYVCIALSRTYMRAPILTRNKSATKRYIFSLTYSCVISARDRRSPHHVSAAVNFLHFLFFLFLKFATLSLAARWWLMRVNNHEIYLVFFLSRLSFLFIILCYHLLTINEYTINVLSQIIFFLNIRIYLTIFNICITPVNIK